MKLGISSCLLGTNCRYDGGHSRDRFITDMLADYFEFVPYCPEKMVFTTPREAIRLVKIDDEIKVRTSTGNIDVTKKLVDISKELANNIQKDDLCGFILKSKSPTCGMERVKVYPSQIKGMSEKNGVGIFAQEIKDKYPLLPLEEDGRLEDAWLRENFLMQIFSYKNIFEFLKTNPSAKELVEFHTSYKYMVYAKSHQSYKELGRIVANHDKRDIKIVLEDYKHWLDQKEKPDIIHASLFCHHLTDAQLVDFFRISSQNVTKAVVINDLQRHPLAYYSIKYLTQWFSKSRFTKNDAPLSVLRGFTKNELKQLLVKAGIVNYEIKWKWAFRFVIIIPFHEN